MAEPLSTAPVGVAPSQQAVLLTTKLYLPHPQQGFVPRPRLVDRMEEALVRGIVLVCAPAGFGKTNLLGDWARRGRHPVAWLSLDQGDNDPARFWRHAVAALDRARPGIAERVAGLLGPPAPASFDGLVTALINELEVQSDHGEVVLVLDDYHLIEARPVHASLEFLLEHRPAGLRLVLASRADPPLALARLRGRGQLAELRAAELRCTAEEAGAVLREGVGPDLPDDAVAVLTAKTEGWVAGLQLAGLSLRGQPDVAGFVRSFSGSHRYVLDFLAEEVLDRQPDDVRAFLLETSVLERLSGELCDAVTGRGDGQAMLELVERASLFLVPLDQVRGWWRFHQLFADLLRVRLHKERPDRVPLLHRNAAVWLEAHGLADEAVRHALAAGDPGWAARLVERHADAVLLRSEGATLARWLAALPDELIGSRPRLLLARTRLALHSGRLEGVEDLLDAAERALERAPEVVEEPYEPSIARTMSLLANVPATIALDRAYLAALCGEPDPAVRFASQALSEAGEREWMLASNARGYLGIAEWLRGQLTEAERLLSSTIEQWRAAGERYLAVRGSHHLGQVQRAQGRLDAALETYQQGLEVAAPSGRPTLPAAGIAHVGMAEVAYQRGELDTALRHVSEGIALARQLSYTQPLATGLATLAWIRQANGEPAEAVRAIEEAERVAPEPGVTGLLNPVPSLRARLLLAQGDAAAAARWAWRRGLGPEDEPSYPREPEYLVLVRVLLAQDLPDRALRLLDRLGDAAAAQRRPGSLIEIQALQALALAAAGDEAAAVAMLAEALTAAHLQGYVRVFADEGPPMATLVGRLVAQRAEPPAAGGVPLDYLARLLRAFDAGHARQGGAATVAAGMVESLTEREVEVLGLLAAGRSNQRIADELVVTLDTVKKHVSHLLDKLGAANRTEAVARARELGLIS
jgi:LuxR family transcriptional regulator, maltose regulon positive regulatory protein